MKERSFGNNKNGWYMVDLFYLKFWVKVTPLERKHQYSIDIRPYRLSSKRKVSDI